MKNNSSYFEKAAFWLAAAFRANKLPFLSAVVSGLFAHMYAFTNKLLNADEISALFSKGATVKSGRWGLLLESRPDLEGCLIYDEDGTFRTWCSEGFVLEEI